MGEWVLIVHAAATWFMTGLIWFVQRVHYPLMDGVAEARFVDYERRHMRTTMPVVALAMLIEAVTAVALVIERPGAGWLWVNLALLVLTWVSTATLQMPAHRRLGGGFDAATHRRLVVSNWGRTAAWSLRAVLVALIVHETMAN